jgi:hypothetical protein|nr:MAG TPA: Cytokine-like protein 1 [Caudoviricetes sp.]
MKEYSEKNKSLINIINSFCVGDMLLIFDDAITHGFEITVEDGKFYYLE